MSRVNCVPLFAQSEPANSIPLPTYVQTHNERHEATLLLKRNVFDNGKKQGEGKGGEQQITSNHRPYPRNTHCCEMRVSSPPPPRPQPPLRALGESGRCLRHGVPSTVGPSAARANPSSPSHAGLAVVGCAIPMAPGSALTGDPGLVRHTE